MTDEDLPYDGPVVVIGKHGLMSDADYANFVEGKAEQRGGYNNKSDHGFDDVASFLEDYISKALGHDYTNILQHADIVEYDPEMVVIEGTLYDRLSHDDKEQLEESDDFDVEGSTVRCILYPEDGGHYCFD